MQDVWANISASLSSGRQRLLAATAPCQCRHLALARGDRRLVSSRSPTARNHHLAQRTSGACSCLQRMVHLEELDMRHVVGSGRFGFVHLARVKPAFRGMQRYMGLQVIAVKKVPLQFASVQEVAHLAALSDHPNIVSFIGATHSTDAVHIAMEHLRGPSLKSFSDAAACGVPAHERHVVLSMAEVAQPVRAVHRAGMAHLDISPHNVMLADEYHPQTFADGAVLVDFGASVTCPSQTPFDDKWMFGRHGTPGYMSPEMYFSNERGEYSPAAADVFSLGACLFDMFVGECPFGVDFSAVDAEPLLANSGFRWSQLYSAHLGACEHLLREQGVSERTIHLTSQCLSQSPHSRPTIDQFLQAAQRICQHL